MANIPVNVDTNLSAISYNHGDSLDLGGSATLFCDTSSLDISTLWANSAIQKVSPTNQTSSIYILNMTGNIEMSNGSMELDTSLITLTSPYTVPLDPLGARPSHIGFLKDSVTGEIYHECTSFSNMYADERGLHFLYDSGTGAITFGDGTNGKIPTGDPQISNFYVEMNGNDFKLGGGVLSGSGAIVFNDCNLWQDHSINLTSSSHWALVNPAGNISTSNLKKNSYANFNIVQTGASARILTLGESTSTDHIIFSIEATPTSEIVGNHNTPLYGTVEARYLTQPVSKQQFAFTRLYNNGGDATVIDLGGNKNIFELRGGFGGTTRIKYSTGYKRTDGGFYTGIWCKNSGTQGKLIWEERIGSEAWPDQARYAIQCSTGDLEIEYQDDFPSDADFYEILNLSGDSTGSVDGLKNLGTSARGSRDYNTFAQKGWIFSNIRMPNDTDHGCQYQDNTEYHHCTMINQTPAFGNGMTNSEIVTNTAGTEGSVWMHPFTATTGNVIFTTNRAYYEPNAVTEQASDIISGVGIATGLVFHGWNTWRFTFEFKIWETSEEEPVSYSSMTLANIQTEQTGFTTSTRWFLKVKVTRNADALDQAYLEGIEVQSPFDSNFVWTPPAPLLPIKAVNFIDGTRVVVINWTKSTKYTDAYGVERILVPVVLDNSVVSGGGGYQVNVRTGAGEAVEVGDTILIKASWHSGTQAKMPLRSLEEMTDSGISIIDEQEDDEIHNNLIFNGVPGIDGSTIDASQGGPLSAHFTNIEINVNDPDDSFDCRLGIAWWRWINTTEQGALVYDALGLVYKPDEYNIEIEGPLKIKNSKVDSELTIINGIWKHYQGETIIASDSETIVWVPNDRLYNANSEQITDIKAAVDQYLDATISSRSTLTDQQVWEYSTRVASVDAGSLHTTLDSYSNKDNWKADTSLLALEATSQTLSGFLNDLLDRHDNECRFYAQDGVTEIEQPDAYYMSLLTDDGMSEVKRISFRDSGNNPVSLTDATRYIKL